MRGLSLMEAVLAINTYTPRMLLLHVAALCKYGAGGTVLLDFESHLHRCADIPFLTSCFVSLFFLTRPVGGLSIFICLYLPLPVKSNLNMNYTTSRRNYASLRPASF